MNNNTLSQVHATLSRLALNNGSYLYVSTSEWARALKIHRKRDLLPVFAQLIHEGKIRLSKGRKARVVGGTIQMKSQRGLRVKVLEMDLNSKPIPGLLSSNSVSHGSQPIATGQAAVQSKSGNGRAEPDKKPNNIINQTNSNSPITWTGTRRQEPKKLERIEQLYLNADMVSEEDLEEMQAVLERQYLEKFGYKWFGLRRKGDITAAKRIRALCWMRGWDEEDFVSVNFTWFKEKTRRRPVVSNVSGERAEERYEQWLTRERYTDRDGQVLGQRRAEELRSLRERQKRTEQKRKRKRLYWQLISWLDRYLANYAKRLRPQGVIRLGKPGWLWTGQKEKLEFWIHRRVALRRQQIIQRWWQRELETT